MRIVILDYGVGNLKSIYNVFKALNYRSVTISRKQEVIQTADVLILPGVGSFQHAMEKLQSLCLVDEILNFAKSNKKIIGICLGMQLLFESSEEFGICKGLGLIPGKITKLNAHKLPNISWNKLQIQDEKNNLDLNINEYFYFIHSFAYKEIDSLYTKAFINYFDEKYSAIVQNENIIGCQFHPEKSGEAGLKLLEKLLKI